MVGLFSGKDSSRAKACYSDVFLTNFVRVQEIKTTSSHIFAGVGCVAPWTQSIDQSDWDNFMVMLLT